MALLVAKALDSSGNIGIRNGVDDKGTQAEALGYGGRRHGDQGGQIEYTFCQLFKRRWAWMEQSDGGLLAGRIYHIWDKEIGD